MEGDSGDDFDDVGFAPRRSLRLALTELNERVSESSVTPNKSANAEEILVAQRGPRRKPLTWSPVDYDRLRIFSNPKEKTPEKTPPPKFEINPKLKRRLIMTSPVKNNPSQDLGKAIAKKLRSLSELQKTSKAN